MTNVDGGKWKTALLSTSLPLELLVAEQLGEAGIFVTGEYGYSRPNASGVVTEFSVDIHAFRFVPSDDIKGWGKVSFLVECKYTHPSVQWIFAPNPNPGAITTGAVNLVETFSTRRVDPQALRSLDDELLYCFKGIELHENDRNQQAIARGVQQLRYGMVPLHSSILTEQLEGWWDEHPWIQFSCAILVTTAPLYILRSGLSLPAFRNAGSVSDIADVVPALVVFQEPGPDISTHIERIESQFFANNPDVEKRLQQHATLLHQAGWPEYKTPNRDAVEYSFRSVTERVLVVNYDSLPEVLNRIVRLIDGSGANMEEHGCVVVNETTGETSVYPVAR
jgi:hypothetical protein